MGSMAQHVVCLYVHTLILSVRLSRYLANSMRSFRLSDDASCCLYGYGSSAC